MTLVTAPLSQGAAGSNARSDASLLGRNWAWLVLRGALTLILGTIAFLFPTSALFAFTLVFAAYAGADGLVSLIAGVRGAARKAERWGRLMLRGIFGIAVAVLFALTPFVAAARYALATLAVLSVWAILAGIFEFAAVVRLRKEIEGEWLLGLSGLLSLLLGLAIPLALYADPVATIPSVAWVIAAYAIIAGVVLISLGLRLRRIAHPVTDGTRGVTDSNDQEIRV
jgi:uncharacterized membrane protein HdeD (DUF308 family)